MPDPSFMSPSAVAAATDGPESGERVMWRGRAGVAEYAVDRAASLPRWTLPESTQVLVTDRRAVYAYTSDRDRTISSGELRWPFPQHLRLQPGGRPGEPGAAVSQIQLVCGSADGSFPALVFAGGDLRGAGEIDRLANVLRVAIARFRVDSADRLGLTANQARALSRLLIGPEFSAYPGGEGRTVSLAGAQPIPRPKPEPIPAVGRPAAQPAAPVSAAGMGSGAQRPGLEADAQRARQAAQAEEATQQNWPDVASRAAELAARVASLVSRTVDTPPNPEPAPATPGLPGRDAAAQHPPTARDPQPSADERADWLRQSSARFGANSARGRAAAPTWEPDGTRPANRNG